MPWKIFYEKYAANVIDFKRKRMLPLTEKELKLQQNSTVCYTCGKNSRKTLLKIKLETIAILQVSIEVQHIVYEI